MKALFWELVNQSIFASWLICAVLVLRIVLKKLPRQFFVLLWMMVGIRLIFPFSIESAFSLIPSRQALTALSAPKGTFVGTANDIANIPAAEQAANIASSPAFSATKSQSADFFEFGRWFLPLVWCIGLAVLLTYTALRYWRLCRKMATAVRYRSNIFESEAVSSPFILGIFRPKIYLPFHLDNKTLEYVLAHEQAHIRRKDHWWKLVGFLCLSVYWPNPLSWLAYLAFCRDIELACDEHVIRTLGSEQRADYTEALVFCSTNRHVISGCPLAFGEIGVRARVQSIFRYKKPTFFTIAAALVVCILVGIGFLTNRPENTVSTESMQAYADKLQKNISVQGDTIVFTLPKGLPTDRSFDLTITGSALSEEGLSRSLHFLDEEAGNWQENKPYTIPLDPAYQNLEMNLFWGKNSTDSSVQTIDLLAIASKFSSQLSQNDQSLLTPTTAQQFIDQVLSTLTLYEDQTISFSLPQTIPTSQDGKTHLSITLSATFSTAPSTYTAQTLLDRETGWQGGDIYKGMLDMSNGELDSIFLGVFFQTEVAPDAYQIYAKGSVELAPPFSYGTPAEYAHPCVEVEQKETQLFLTYTLTNGQTTRLSFTVPEGVTAKIAPAISAYHVLFLYQNSTVGWLDLQPFGIANPQDLMAVDPAENQLPMQIFSSTALSNHAGYEDYLVKRHWSTGAVASAKYTWQDLAESLPAAAMTYQTQDCILMYDWAIMPYFVELKWQEDFLSAPQAAQLENSITLSAPANP